MSQPLPTQMQAATLEDYGGPEVITLHTLDVPEVADDELLLQVHTAGVGVWDAVAREGKMLPEGATLPLVLGTDAAGKVLAVGKEVTNVAVGDTVYLYSYTRPKGGFYAQYGVTKAVYAAPLPAGLSVEQAGAMPTDALTALSGLDTLAFAEGNTLLILGASGGLGHLALQLAKRQGLRVIAVASGDDGVALVQRLGADLALGGHAESSELAAKIRDFAPGRGRRPARLDRWRHAEQFVFSGAARRAYRLPQRGSAAVGSTGRDRGQGVRRRDQPRAARAAERPDSCRTL